MSLSTYIPLYYLRGGYIIIIKEMELFLVLGYNVVSITSSQKTAHHATQQLEHTVLIYKQ